MLTTRKVDALKPKKRQYKVSDKDGLFLIVTPKGTKSWRYNFKSNNKWTTKTYGIYPVLSLAGARKEHIEFREQLESGIFDIEDTTFADLFEEWYPMKCKKLKHPKTEQVLYSRYKDYLERDLAPLGIKNLPRVKLVSVVKKIDATGKNETARRVASMLKQMLDYAVDCGYIEHHSAAGLTRVLDTAQAQHMKCIEPGEVGRFLSKIDEYYEPVTKIALEFLVRTFPRTIELRSMVWDEIVDGKYWIIPPHKMKNGKSHLIPLSNQCVEMLERVKEYTGGCKYVFASRMAPNKMISENTLLFAIYRLGYKGQMTGHGVRALASTILNESTNYKYDAIEKQLAHKQKNVVRAAYNRAEYFEERVEMMQWYSDWLDTKKGEILSSVEIST